MLRNRLYFRLKPFLPRFVRMAFRRRVAARLRDRHRAVWPVMPGSEAPPAAWPGWPDGKKFAFVLTHDVEGPRGVQNSKALMELEREMGFRSSFNFIPEGTYSVSPELRKEICDSGFEVGIHDLRHDGFLYRSRSEFHRNASRINHYLTEWEAAGFRSGFMLRELDWLHDLNVLYDASTFDTDPFEPQPQGAATIFPWFVPPPVGADRGGYVELPYTLPQDSTLFLILKETSPDIWLRKLDWVASHGGMALVNIHPDYIDFSGRGQSSSTYPVEMVRQLLYHVSSQYGGSYWNPIPRELARWYRGGAWSPPVPSGIPSPK